MGKRNFRGQSQQGGKKKRKKINLVKLSKMNKDRIEREKKRYAPRYNDVGKPTATNTQDTEVLSSDDEEEAQQLTSYQQLLVNLGSKKGGDYELSDEESEDEDEDNEEDIEAENDDEAEVEDDEEGEGDEEIEDDNEEEEEDGGEQEDTGAHDKDKPALSDVTRKDDIEEGEEEEEEDDDNRNEDEEESDQGDSESGEKEDEDEDENQLHQTQDPFYKRVNHDVDEQLVEVLSQARPSHKFETKWPCLGRLSCASFDDDHRADVTICKDQDFKSLHIPKRVASSWRKANSAILGQDSEKILSPLQQELFSVMQTYQDLMYPERTYKNAEEIRLAYCLHILSHIVKSRNHVQKHNSMLSADPSLDTETMRDQGLTRPRVLILVPFRNSALEIIKTFSKILIPEGQQMSHKKRFFDEYGYAEKEPAKRVKPEDWEATFAGNIDDHFRLGVSITRKGFKLYSTFYLSDIIIASPLGIRTVLGSKGDKHHEYDFLSSIELLVMDQTDVFLMQNWEHVVHIMDHMHLQPKDSHGVDFSRVRMWALNKWTKYYRQTLVFSSITCPEINALVSKQCANWAGRVSTCNVPTIGTISQVVVQLPQVFRRVVCDSFASSHEKRFQCFISKILPQYRESLMAGTMIFVPSYFDFVRVRNYFRKQEINFAQICEYTSTSNISRARLYMMKGTRHFLLVTERFHFFRRYKIRGIRQIVFYQLPSYPHYYSELCNMLEASPSEGAAQEHTGTILYTKYDAQRLGSVVGMQRNAHMLNSEKDVHMFVSGDG